MEKEQYESARKSLERVQNFQAASLDRREVLGEDLNFKECISYARRLVDLFNKISPRTLEDFSSSQLSSIQTQSDQVFNLFQRAIEFKTNQDNAVTDHADIVKSIESQYNRVFEQIYHFASYSASKTADFQKLEQEGRAAVQRIDDRVNELYKSLESTKAEAEQILIDVRKTAAEQGVSQQSFHFNQEAEYHDNEANKWRAYTYRWSGGLVLVALVGFAVHKVPWLTPINSIEAYQLIASKILIFVSVLYMLFLSAKNYLSHKHNSVVNKQRQNALLTYKALVDAGGSKETRDIVLRYAASSIFSPQDTGYVKSSGGQPSSASALIELGSHASDVASN